MWSQGGSQPSAGGVNCSSAVVSKMTVLQILPCSVSQLLSASKASSDTFALCDQEFNQVSVVGIVRELLPFVKYVQYALDDMTGPPLTVRQWDCTLLVFASPGTYVKVIGSLRSSTGERSLQAKHIRVITDLNEITSHMLEVVHAHMQILKKKFDVNMNITAVPSEDLPSVQGQVLHVIRRGSVRDIGIGYKELQSQLDLLSPRDIKSSLTSLMDKGLVYHTIDENHFKSTDC
ncbi:Replication protein A 32 kDa subunit [Dissostichus eleginoides]|uniref:Replication protein A 32 kDa subunit n=1 Tax=Dissostichus eleginoides TaxID=100907 RepID=A0AAD9BRX3_DISEL|nr:Replication protein A 32 kDa subunit [Dissostichus eleginoides]